MTQPTLRSLLPTCIAGLALLACPGTANATFSEDCPYGVNAHQASDQELELAAAAGIGWVRMDFNWYQFETSRGSYDWSVPDRFVGKAEELGLNVFATVAYTPSWAVSGSCNDSSGDEQQWCRNAVPASSSYWTDFVSAAVGRYGDRIKHWGMWNEPNLSGFFRGTRDEYVDIILVPGSDAVHAACPDCYVLGPELAHMRSGWDEDEGTCIGGECIFNGWEVSLREILDEAGQYIDIITHHNYEDPSSALWSELADGEWLIIQYMHGVKEITDAYAPGKTIWLTEFGYETDPGGDYSEADAASELEETFEDLFAIQLGTLAGVDNQPWPEMEKLFWYDMTDDPNEYDGELYTWGLLESDHTPKQAWYSYQDLIAYHGSCWVEDDDPVEDTGDPAPDTGDPGEDPGEDTGEEDTDQDPGGDTGGPGGDPGGGDDSGDAGASDGRDSALASSCGSCAMPGPAGSLLVLAFCALLGVARRH